MPVSRSIVRLSNATGAAVIVVTHNAELARSAARVVRILDGKIVEP